MKGRETVLPPCHYCRPSCIGLLLFVAGRGAIAYFFVRILAGGAFAEGVERMAVLNWPAPSDRPMNGLARLAIAAFAALVIAAPASAEKTVPQDLADIQFSFAPLVRAVSPAVVDISGWSYNYRDPGILGTVKALFDGIATKNDPINGGSGVILRWDGVVITNDHVVGNASYLEAVLPDGREFEAVPLYRDAEADVAILALKGATDVPFVLLDDGPGPEPGDLAVSLGYPYDLGLTASEGIIAGLPVSQPRPEDPTTALLQLSLPTYPGNSGGALVNMQGRLIGLPSQVEVRDDVRIPMISYAVPTPALRRALDLAGLTSDMPRWLGFAGRAQRSVAVSTKSGKTDGRTSAAAEPLRSGVVLTSLHPDSPLLAAGLRVGDLVTSLGTYSVSEPDDLMVELLRQGTRRDVRIAWLRDKKMQSALVRPFRAPGFGALPATVAVRGPLSGMKVTQGSPYLRQRFGWSDDPRELIVLAGPDRPARGSTASGYGIASGDGIVAVGGAVITTVDDLRRAAASATSGRSDAVAVTLVRRGQQITVTLGN
jgi:S1-C subfamily serine protease